MRSVQAPVTKAPAWLLLPPEWLESTARNEHVRRFLFATDAIYECVPANTNPEAKWSSRRRQTAPTPAPTRWLVRQWCSKDGRLQRPGKKCQDCQENKKQNERVGIFFVREKKKLSGKKKSYLLLPTKRKKVIPRLDQVVKLSGSTTHSQNLLRVGPYFQQFNAPSVVFGLFPLFRQRFVHGIDRLLHRQSSSNL